MIGPWLYKTGESASTRNPPVCGHLWCFLLSIRAVITGSVTNLIVEVVLSHLVCICKGKRQEEDEVWIEEAAGADRKLVTYVWWLVFFWSYDFSVYGKNIVLLVWGRNILKFYKRIRVFTNLLGKLQMIHIWEKVGRLFRFKSIMLKHKTCRH